MHWRRNFKTWDAKWNKNDATSKSQKATSKLPQNEAMHTGVLVYINMKWSAKKGGELDLLYAKNLLEKNVQII